MTTISDVARRAGVSKATVSRVISGKAYVSDEIAARVQQAMKALSYRPNAMAQALATNRSNGIGMVINELSSPYYGLMMSGVEQAVEPYDMHLIVASTHARKDRERAAVDFLLQRQCDGLVLHMDALSDEELVEISRGAIPIVIINRLVGQLETQSVYSDDELGGRLATQYLIANGHRRIACMTGPLRLHESRERLSGYEAALREYGIAADPSLVIESTFTVDGGYCAALNSLLTRDEGITAVFSQNDQMALGIYNACRELALTVPEDISVVGFDDIEWARYLNPKLTTVRQHVREMGMAAGRCLVHALGRDAHGDAAPEELVTRFEPELIVRESVRSLT